MQLLWINLLMDTWAVLCLAFQIPRETPSKFIYTMHKKDPLIDGKMLINIILQASGVSVICLIIY